MRQSWRRREQVSVVALLLAALILRVYALDRQSIWYDEANGVRIAARPITDIFSELQADASPPLYYLLLHGWTRWLGTGEFAVRSLSAILGTAFVALLIWTARERWGTRAAVAAGALAAFSQFHLYYSQETRMYAMLTCLVILALQGAMRAAANGRPRDWILYGSACLLTVYTHNYGLFVVLGCAIWLMLHSLQKPDARRGVAIVHLAIAAGYLPWVPFLLRHQILGTAITGGWLPRFTPAHLPETLLHYCSLSMVGATGILLWIGLPAFTLICGRALIADTGKQQGSAWPRLNRDPAVSLCLAVLATGTLLPMLISIIHPIYLPHRYSVAAWPAFVLLAGHGLAKLTSRPLLAAVIAALGVTTAAALAWHMRVMEKAPDRDVAAYVAERLQANDLLVVSPHWTAVSLTYYLGPLPHQAGFPMKALEERKERNEAFERETRTLTDMLALTDKHFDTHGGRLLLVSMPWADEARALQKAFDQRYQGLERTARGQFHISLYSNTTPTHTGNPEPPPMQSDPKG